MSVVYVGSGQTTENDTFNNSNVSLEFQNFANGLGWVLDSNEYQAYHNNNNSAKFNDLPQILFYANHNVELLIHVSNLIPQIGNRKVVLMKNTIAVVWVDDPLGTQLLFFFYQRIGKLANFYLFFKKRKCKN